MFFYDPISKANATTLAISMTSRSPEGHYAADMPGLCGSRRGRERHITSDDLEKMVVNIKEKKQLEPLPAHDYLASSIEETPNPETPEVPIVTAASPPRIVESLSSDSASVNSEQAPLSESSCTSEKSTTSVVKELSFAHISNSYRSPNNLNLHLSSSISDANIVAITAAPALNNKGGMFDFHFVEVEDDIDESAIDDDEDDSSDWKDCNEESNNVSIDEKTFFQRVNFKVYPESRPSLITLAFNNSNMSKSNSALQRPSTLQLSRPTLPSGPSLATSPDEPLMIKPVNLKPIAEIPALAPRRQSIINTTNTISHQLALSPKTTRRNMLQIELPPSLCEHLLHERHQKTRTANAVLKRRHTAHNVTNLKQYPETVHINDSNEQDANNASWNQYFSQGLGEYHSKGW